MSSSKKPIKVLVVLPFLHQGGAQRQISYLVEHIDKSRFDIHIGYFVNEAIFYKNLLPENGHSHLFGGGKRITPRSFFSMIRQVHQIKPDIVHAYVQPADFLAGFAHYFFPNIPLVFSLGMSKQPLWRYRLYRFLNKRPSMVSCNSERIRKELIQLAGFPEEKVVLALNPLDTDKFAPFTAAQKKKAREIFGFSRDNLVLASIGRISPQKNQVGTVRAIQLLRQTGKLPEGFKFVFIGNPQYRKYENEVRQVIQESGLQNICLLRDPTEDIVSFYNAVDGIFQPSRHEGLSNAVIECQASGTPVALSKEGDNDQLVLQGKTGISFSIQSDQEMASGLQQLIELCKNEQEKAAVVQQARAQVIQKFSVKNAIQFRQAIYEKVLEKEEVYDLNLVTDPEP